MILTAAEWTALNPVPDLGEFCLESDTGNWKRGTGAAPYTALRYEANTFGLKLLGTLDQAAAQTLIGTTPGPQGPSGIVDPIPGGLVTIPRAIMQVASGTLTSGAVRLTYKDAEETITVNNLTARSGTATPASITLSRMGIYSVDVATGDLTLIGSTANDTALFSVASTVYTKALTAAVSLTKGARYAFAFLQVATTPATISGLALDAAEAAVTPRITGSRSSQTDLPSTITAAAISNSGTYAYIRAS